MVDLEKLGIHDVDLGRLDPTTDTHEWLFPQRSDRPSIGGAVTDRIEAMIHLRDYIEDRPPYSATFRLSDVAKGTPYDYNWFLNEMLWLADSWLKPDIYTGADQDGRQWVNPGYKDAPMYSDTIAKCRCGTLVTKTQHTGAPTKLHDPNKHEENCKLEWRLEALSELFRNRRRLLARTALLAKSARSQNDRMHIRKNDASHLVDTLGMEYYELRQIGFEKRRNTICKIIEEGYDTADAARIYDISAARVRDIISTETEHTITELRP